MPDATQDQTKAVGEGEEFAPTPAMADAPLPPPIMRSARDREEPEDKQPEFDQPGAIAAARDGVELNALNQHSATEWFLSPEPDDEGVSTKVIELNVGSPSKPRWIKWEIRAVDMDLLRDVRRKQNNRAARRAGAEVDDVKVNLALIVEATIDPDLPAIAAQLGVRDPADALAHRFKNKPGLIGQISAEIFDLSGFNDEDVRDAEAAGNS